VRRLRAPLAAIEQAIERMERGEYSSKVILRKSNPPARSPSGPPIPLVRRPGRDGPPTGEVEIDTLGVLDIVEQMEADGDITDELGQPIMPLTSSKVPIELEREPRFPPFARTDAALEALARAATRDEVIAHLIDGMSAVARRVGAFAVKKRSYRGIACNADFGDAASFRAVEIAIDAPTVLAIAAKKSSYFGRLPATLPHEPLRRLMSDDLGEVATVLVSIAGRPAVILFAASLADTTMASQRAEELAREASAALARIVTDAKIAKRGSA
jgi:hypothetical protein